MTAVKKTTVYLPEDLKRSLEGMAKRQRRSEASIIRDAVAVAVSTPPAPRIPLVDQGLGDEMIAERVDELLFGFGED